MRVLQPHLFSNRHGVHNRADAQPGNCVLFPPPAGVEIPPSRCIVCSFSPHGCGDYLPTEGDAWPVRLSPASVCRYTTSWRQFKSDCHQTSSVIPLATGDEVIKFWKVKLKDQGLWGGIRSTERSSSYNRDVLLLLLFTIRQYVITIKWQH